MSRRHRAEKREVLPDPKFGDLVLTKFMNYVMHEGKKAVAENIVYGAFDIIETKRRDMQPLEVFHSFFRDGKPFIGGKHPSIADIRLAATLEFLAVIDYALPKWAKEYVAAIEKKLGKAYAEPAGDVRGYIAYVRSQAKASA